VQLPITSAISVRPSRLSLIERIKPLHPPNPFAISADFQPATQPNTEGSTAPAWWFVCQGSHLLVISGDQTSFSLPQADEIERLGIEPVLTQFLGYLNAQPCWAVGLAANTELPAGMKLENLRSLYNAMPETLFAIAARAVQIMEWDRTTQFCSCCATPMIQRPTERAKRCPACHHRQYPQLSPAVIMLVYKGDQILLARAPRFRAGMYSVLAGFVEPGESLEEAVAREVEEEVGIEVKNIQYFGSQPWPFPKSLMLGFVAEYKTGELTPDLEEIEAADWFTADQLPPIPGELSIAYKLIDWFVQRNPVDHRQESTQARGAQANAM